MGHSRLVNKLYVLAYICKQPKKDVDDDFYTTDSKKENKRIIRKKLLYTLTMTSAYLLIGDVKCV